MGKKSYKKNIGVYYLFSINIKNKHIFYLSNPFSTRRIIFLKFTNTKNT